MNRACRSIGNAACSAGLNRSVWPTASRTPADSAAAIIASASRDRRRHRLLDEHVDAALQALQRDGKMTRGRHGNRDGIHAAQHRAIVFERLRRRALNRRTRAVADQIDGGDELDARHRGEQPDVMPAEMAHADDGHAQAPGRSHSCAPPAHHDNAGGVGGPDKRVAVEHERPARID